MADDAILFVASTPLGFQVRVTGAYWEIIVTVKHPVMAGVRMMSKRRWKTRMKSVSASQIKMFICFTKQNLKKDGFAQFQNKQAVKAFLLRLTQQTQSRKEYRYGTSKSLL
jgi:hypothetical protein